MMSKKIRLKKGEVFKEIEGYKDRYYISNKGRLWSNVSGKFIGSKNPDGYIYTALINEDGEREDTSIHREVGKAFVPNDDPENKTEINHKNYKRDDNRAENLEWVSHQENLDYSYENIYTEENRKNLSNNMKERVRKFWEDEDFRELQSNLMKERSKDPNFQAKQLEGIKKKWEDEDFRKKMSERQKKKWEDEDYRKKMSERQKKKWEDEDFRKKMIETNSKRIKELNKDPNFQAKRLEASRKAKCKPVLQYTEEGELVSKFSSQVEAAEKTEICRTSIGNALKGKYKTAGGFIWKYDQ